MWSHCFLGFICHGSTPTHCFSTAAWHSLIRQQASLPPPPSSVFSLEILYAHFCLPLTWMQNTFQQIFPWLTQIVLWWCSTTSQSQSDVIENVHVGLSAWRWRHHFRNIRPHSQQLKLFSCQSRMQEEKVKKLERMSSWSHTHIKYITMDVIQWVGTHSHACQQAPETSCDTDRDNHHCHGGIK